MKGLFNKLKENKKILIPLISILLLIVLLTGVSFAVFNYSNDNAGNNDINSGFISMTYTEPSNEYVVENALPMKDTEGMNTTNYFEFTVTTTAPTNDTDDNGVSIPYEISITELEGNTLTNDKIKMYVTEVEGEKEVVNTNPTLISNLESSLYKDGQIKVGFNLHLHRDSNETVTTKYRLRAWVDYDVDVSDWETTGEFIYKFKVNVNGEATYQGYVTDHSCFTYGYNDDGLYSIMGYDYATCGGKNIVVPTEVEEETTDIVLLAINWVTDEEFIEAYKNFTYEQGMCSVDTNWDECLISLNTTEAEQLAEYSSAKPIFNKYIGREKTVLEDEEVLDSLNMFADIGFCSLEWTDGSPTIVTRKIQSIYSFSQPDVVVTNNVSEEKRVDNLNKNININNNVKFLSNNEPVINGLVVSNSLGIYYEAFAGYVINKMIDEHGNFPSGCFEYTSDSNAITINNYLCTGVINLKIPPTIENLPVKEIGYAAFSREYIESVILPNTIEIIREGAFSNNKLITIDIPDSVTSLSGFDHNQLTTIDIPNGVTTIERYAFEYNQLTSVIIPDSVINIVEKAFYKNELINVVIGNGATTIGDYAFGENELTIIDIPDSITYIGYGAFKNNKLTNATIGNSVHTIKNFAFEDNQLKSITIPDSVTSIGYQAFYKSETSNQNLTKIINKTGKVFDWEGIIGSGTSALFVTGTVTNQYGNVEIVSE